MVVPVRYRVQEGTCKHVARAIGVHRAHCSGGHHRMVGPLQHHAAARTTRQAHHAGKLPQLLADCAKVLCATPDLGFLFVAEQIVQTFTDHGLQPATAELDHAHVAQCHSQRYARFLGHGAPPQGCFQPGGRCG